MKQFFVFIFFLLSSFLIAQNQDGKTQESINKLLAQGYINENNEKYGFFVPLEPFTIELMVMTANGKNIDDEYEYSWIDDNILYVVVFHSKTSPNMCVFAFILEEEDKEEKWRTNSAGVGIHIQDENRYGKYAGNEYFVTKIYYKINENNEPAIQWIAMDINKDGIYQENEGRYVWF